MSDVHVICGTTDDLKILMAHRKALWLETGPWTESDVAGPVSEYEKWLRVSVENARVIPFLGKIGDTVAGSGSIWIRDIRPAPGRSKQSEAVLIGMYTEPEFRRKKVASAILDNAIGWCKARDFDELVLHSSDQGMAMYRKRGFNRTSEMRLRLV